MRCERGVSVESRIDCILSSGSPLIEPAESQGLMQANRRGLLKSTVASGAAQPAMTDAALSTATQAAG
jgi:hypothetical protein